MKINFAKQNNHFPVGFALLAAVLFGLNAPLSKLLLQEIPPLFMAGFLYLYLGAGLGMALIQVCSMKCLTGLFSSPRF